MSAHVTKCQWGPNDTRTQTIRPDRDDRGRHRQTRYRARLAGLAVEPEPHAPASPRRKPGRQTRWDAGIALLRAVVRAEYAAWLETMPEPLRDTPTGEAVQAIVEFDLDEIATIYLPKGYGRD
jgi:hypothetical protein